MSDHRIMIIECQDKAKNKCYVALSSEIPDLSEDSLVNMGQRYIGLQKSNPSICWTIFGTLNAIIVTDCSLPLSDRLNNIQFKPVYELWDDCGNDSYMAGANPVQPVLRDQPIPEDYIFAKHYIIPSCS